MQATKRNRRRLTARQVAELRRMLWLEMRRAGATFEFIGLVYGVTGPAVRAEVAKGLPIDLDPDLMALAVQTVAATAHLIPAHHRRRGPNPLDEPPPTPPPASSALEQLRAERRSRLAAKRAGKPA